MSQRVYGWWNVTTRPSAPTTIADKGPNMTAANTTGRRDAVSSTFEFTRTGRRSASIESAPRINAAQAGPNEAPLRTRPTASPQVTTDNPIPKRVIG
jgi:hypothetical protein